MSDELERLVSACLLPGFAGLEPPDWLRRRLSEGLRGVVLFGRNVADPEQLSSLTRALRAERSDVLVAIDEEGGDVTRLEVAAGSSYPGNAALGAVDDVGLTAEVGAAMAGELASVGVNLDLAPVADVNSDPANPVVGVRSFGDDPALVARHVSAFVSGMQEVGVAACAKHFPGHGGTTHDSHLELPIATADGAGLAAALGPFRAAIVAGVQAIMTAHVVVPVLSDEPATLSRVALRTLLRDELGFGGLAVTDALEMGAVSATVGVEEGAVRALAAGADALCLGRDLGPLDVERVHTAIVEAVRAGRLSDERLGEAEARVVAAASWASPGSPARPPARDAGARAARRALRADGELSLRAPSLVVELVPEPSIAAGEAGRGLGEALRKLSPSSEVLRLRQAPADPAALLAGYGVRSLVVAVRDAHRHRWQREVAEAFLRVHRDVVVVETGLPVWHPDGGRGYAATYGAGRVNLAAAAERLVAGGS
jgi:beta-N-acetylhexosaminidase